MTAGEARAYLARFLFRGDDAFKEVRLLSGGERSRLELALLGIQPSNLLLLDEPTNHLDIPAREAIEAFMAESPATLLVVSHDRRLARDGVRPAVGRGGWVGGGVRWRISRVAGGGGEWVDGDDGARARSVLEVGDAPAVATLPGPSGAAPNGTRPRAPAGAGATAGAATDPATPPASGRRKSCPRRRIGGRRLLLRGS